MNVPSVDGILLMFLKTSRQLEKQGRKVSKVMPVECIHTQVQIQMCMY